MLVKYEKSVKYENREVPIQTLYKLKNNYTKNFKQVEISVN